MKSALLLFAALLTLPAFADVQHAIGVARSDKTGEIRYIEHHQNFDDGTRRIEYFTPSLETLIVKQLSYPGLPHHPRVELRDLANNTRILFEPVEEQLRMVVERDGERQERFVERDASVVYDAGFDGLIKTEWDSLIESGKKEVQFAVPVRDATLAMMLAATPLTDSITGFTLQGKSFVVRMFLPAIELEYRNSDRRLVRFSGPSNINAKDGDQKITAKFAYFVTDERVDIPLQQWLPDEMSSAVATRAD